MDKSEGNINQNGGKKNFDQWYHTTISDLVQNKKKKSRVKLRNISTNPKHQTK